MNDYLKNKTRILVSSTPSNLEIMDRIIILKDGQIETNRYLKTSNTKLMDIENDLLRFGINSKVENTNCNEAETQQKLCTNEVKMVVYKYRFRF